MARLGVFVERYTIANSGEMGALMRLSHEARKLGHDVDYLFRPDICRIPQFDAVYIRALTDPLNTSYVAARYAELHGKPVLDDGNSIIICCDKVNMYRHLMRKNVPIPATVFLTGLDLTEARGEQLLADLGTPLVLKAPNSSFSLYVDRVRDSGEYVRVGRRFLRRSDRLVAQQYVKSDFDWRVGVLRGRVAYVCQYTFPNKQWKILAYGDKGRQTYGRVIGQDSAKCDPELLNTAVMAANSIGNGFYGVDLKHTAHGYLVIEVNDNPTINAGEEDEKAPHIYRDIVEALLG